MPDRLINPTELMAHMEDLYYPFTLRDNINLFNPSNHTILHWINGLKYDGTDVERIHKIYKDANRVYEIIRYLIKNKYANISEEERETLIVLESDEIEMIQACFEAKLYLLHKDFLRLIDKGETND